MFGPLVIWLDVIIWCVFVLLKVYYLTKKTVSTGEDEDEEFKDSDDIVSRTQFPESWLWEDDTLPTCAEKHW